MTANLSKNDDANAAEENLGCLYVKVSMDGAPYLRKVDLKTCKNYSQLSKALEKMFDRFTLGILSLSLSLSQVSCTFCEDPICFS